MVNLDKQEFVGTQSRFLSIVESLKRIAEGTQVDPAKRIRQLKEKRKGLEREIRQIEETGRVERLDETHVKELFLNLLEDSRRLLSDFRLVEEIFQDLTRKIKEEKLKAESNRGDIVGQVLDAYDYLEASDQGKSFNAFWKFLISSEQQGELKGLIQIVLDAPEIQDLVSKNQKRGYAESLNLFKARLLQVGQKALQSKTRLAEELRRLLHQKSLQENFQIMEDIREIKKSVLEARERFWRYGNRPLLELSHLPKVQLPMERPLWTDSAEKTFEVQKIQSASEEIPQESLDALFNRAHVVDLNELEERVWQMLETRSRVTLPEVLSHFKHSREAKGLAELIGYLQIASREPHWIDEESSDRIEWTSSAFTGSAELPRVVYLAEGEKH